jgi:hypothetical protein
MTRGENVPFRPTQETHLSSDGLEESVDHTVGKAPLLVLVHFNDLTPVRGYLGKMEGLGEID